MSGLSSLASIYKARSGAATECGGVAANRATPLVSRAVEIPSIQSDMLLLFKEDPLQGLKQNPATGLRLERTVMPLTVRSTLCVEAVSSYKCQLAGIELVKTHFMYCAVCRFTVDLSQKSGEASCCIDFFGNTPKASALLAARTGKSACITTCARHLELRNATCHSMYRTTSRNLDPTPLSILRYSINVRPTQTLGLHS